MHRSGWLAVLAAVCTLTLAAEEPTPLPESPHADIDAPIKAAWFSDREQGWFWYQDPPDPAPSLEAKPKAKPDTWPGARPDLPLYPSLAEPMPDPLATLERLQKAVETAKARAVLQPTESNALAWLRVNRELMDRNTLFADVVQRAVWRNPAYDYSLVRPHNPVGLGAYNAAFNAERKASMAAIAEEYGLYFVVRGNCPYCHEFAPYLRRFAEAHGFTVIAVSLDGGGVPDYPDPLYSPDFASRFNVETVPAVYLAKPADDLVEPVAFGVVSLSELESRIYRLFRLQPGQMNYRLRYSYNRDDS